MLNRSLTDGVSEGYGYFNSDISFPDEGTDDLLNLKKGYDNYGHWTYQWIRKVNTNDKHDLNLTDGVPYFYFQWNENSHDLTDRTYFAVYQQDPDSKEFFLVTKTSNSLYVFHGILTLIVWGVLVQLNLLLMRHYRSSGCIALVYK